MDEEDEDDDDPSFGEKKKKKASGSKTKVVKEPRISGPPKLKKREFLTCNFQDGSSLLALASFPLRKDKGESSDEDYGSKSHKKKPQARRPPSGQSTPDGFADADAAWRRGAAKKVVTYDEGQVDYGLASEEEEDAYYQAQEASGLGGAADEVDQVLSHSRDEDRLADPADIPQENLVSHLGVSKSHADNSAFPCKVEGLLSHSQHR